MSESRIDTEALEETRGTAYLLALRITGSEAAAEDAVQEAYIKALVHGMPADPTRDMRTWFLRIVANAAKDLRRSEARRRRREETAMQRPVASHEQDEEVRETLRASLRQLEEKFRVPVSLHYEAGLTHAEIAAVLGLPEGTVATRVSRGLGRLRERVRCSGLALAPLMLLRALTSGSLDPAPASLAGVLEKAQGAACSAAVAGKGTAAATAAKGGVAMKAIAGIVAAGALAGAVAVSTGDLFSVGGGDGKPAPVNPYKGMQEREEVFEFTTKPAVKKEGGKWVITFASKGKCDATVAIVDGKGRIVRHLASGVLGSNAPHPFQQNSLSQKIEWDGEDDMGAKAPAGCKVKVSLGLKAGFEKNIAYSPYDMTFIQPGSKSYVKSYVVEGGDGNVIVGTSVGDTFVRVYDKDRKYVRTLWPPSADEVEKVGPKFKWSMTETIWGDKVPVPETWFQFRIGGRRGAKLAEDIKTLTGIDGAKAVAYAETRLPLLEDRLIRAGIYAYKNVRLAVNPATAELYGGSANGVYRYDGKTGNLDKTWFTGPKDKLYTNSELHVGPDGLLYMRIGIFAYGKWIVRMDRTGKIVPFKENAVTIPADARMVSNHFRGKPGALWTGVAGHSNTHQRGLYVSPRGNIVAGINEVDLAWAKKHGIRGGKGKRDLSGGWAAVWNKDGKLLSADAVGYNQNGHGVAMDRAGNLYVQFGQTFLPGQKSIDGIKDVSMRKGGWRRWGGVASVIKFRGLGGKYPLNVGPALKTMRNSQGPKPLDVPGGLWAYAGANQCMGCTCHNTRWTQDYWARTWIPAHHLYSIMVIDSNGNRVVRLGRYGNVDDTEKDLEEDRDGLRFAWARAVAVSDTAMYVTDAANRRILKAKLGYHAEEELPLP